MSLYVQAGLVACISVLYNAVLLFFVEREGLKTRAVKFLSFFIFANSSFLTIAADLCKRVMF